MNENFTFGDLFYLLNELKKYDAIEEDTIREMLVKIEKFLVKHHNDYITDTEIENLKEEYYIDGKTFEEILNNVYEIFNKDKNYILDVLEVINNENLNKKITETIIKKCLSCKQ